MVVKHPATAPAGGWELHRLTVCLLSNPNTCPIKDQDCTYEFRDWDCDAAKQCNYCLLTGLEASTQYTIQVRDSRAALSGDASGSAAMLRDMLPYHSALRCRVPFQRLACRPNQ